MKAPSNPMEDRTFMAGGGSGGGGDGAQEASMYRFHQRLAALSALKGRKPYWLRDEDVAKLSGIDAMPHPDIDINDDLTT
jgi:hypothetical protein